MADRAKIYQPPRCVMQAGQAKSKKWILEYTPNDARYVEPVMGWIGSGYTKTQCQLKFSTLEEALAYAKRNNIVCDVLPDQKPALKPKSYSSNFSANRIQ